MTDRATIPGLRVDLRGATPVYRQIADAVRDALRDGRLRPGDRLPPTRDLSRRLGVNRNTVVSAYEWLAAVGLVVSHTGRGTFVVDPAAGTAPGPATARSAGYPPPVAAGAAGSAADPGAPDGGAWFTSFSRAVEGPGIGQLLSVYRVVTSADGISFAGTYPAAELLPIDGFRRALDGVLREHGADVLAYGPTGGYPPLREAVAADMRRHGSDVRPGGVLITNGAQQAIDLAFRTILDRGDAVVIEEPTYTGALSALHSLGARLVGVPLDAEGIRPDLLAGALERHRPKLIYVQPTFQNPTTAVMGEARRREVLRLAARYRCAVVEDDWAGDLQFGGERLPTLHALDRGRRVIYLSTFSKKLLPGLRVGWVAAPGAVMERLVALKQIQDFGTSPLVQAALHRFLDAGELDGHLSRALPAYRQRRDAMLDALRRHFPREARWTSPDGGLFVWVTLPHGFDSNELFVSARQRGVSFCRGGLFHSNDSGRRFLRLTYGGVSPEQIDSGIAILGELLRQRSSDSAGSAASTVEAVPIL